MHPAARPLLRCVLSILIAGHVYAQGGLDPGSVYREFSRYNRGDLDWRVTDPAAIQKFPQAQEFLPNPTLPLEITDLRDAIRAELLLERWGGHRGTINKRIRVNQHEWLTVPELQSVPAGKRPENLYFQDNPVIPIPLAQLREGVNVFEAACEEEGGFGWGQWGLYSLVVRVYYPPDSQPSISGEILVPLRGATIRDHPDIRVQADAVNGVSRIEVVAYYDGFDHDGDGLFAGWHHSRFQPARGLPNDTQDHVGTLWKEPYELTWNTHWVPDQAPKFVKLVARIQDSRGLWTVTQPVEDLTLDRSDVSVKLYTAVDVPEDFGVRNGETKHCHFELPPSTPLDQAVEAALHFRSWHGSDAHHAPLQLNDQQLAIHGKNHFYDYDLLRFATSGLRSGENTLTIHSATEHHQLEVLWPGPALVIRYQW